MWFNSFSAFSSRSRTAFLAFRVAQISSSKLICKASLSLFCVSWIRKTIRNVIIVVPVFITSCQVSLKLESGPVTPQATLRRKRGSLAGQHRRYAGKMGKKRSSILGHKNTSLRRNKVPHNFRNRIQVSFHILVAFEKRYRASDLVVKISRAPAQSFRRADLLAAKVDGLCGTQQL